MMGKPQASEHEEFLGESPGYYTYITDGAYITTDNKGNIVSIQSRFTEPADEFWWSKLWKNIPDQMGEHQGSSE